MCVECQSEKTKKEYERECAVWNCSGNETRRDDRPADYAETVMERCDDQDFKDEYPKEGNEMATVTLKVDMYRKGKMPETVEEKDAFITQLEKELPWLESQVAVGRVEARNSFAIEIIIIPGKESVFKLAHRLSQIAAGKGKDKGKFNDSTKNPILSQLLYPGKQTQKEKEQELIDCQNQVTATAKKATDAEDQVQTIKSALAECHRKEQKLLALRNIHTREWKLSRAEQEIESKRLHRLQPHVHKHRTGGRRTTKGTKSKGARCKPGQCAGSMTCSRKTKKCWHGKGRGQGTKCVPGQCKGSLQCSRRTKRCH